MQVADLWLDIKALGATLAGPRIAPADRSRGHRWMIAFLLIAIVARILDILTSSFAVGVNSISTLSTTPDVDVCAPHALIICLVSFESIVRTLLLFGWIVLTAVCAYLLSVVIDAPAVRFLPLLALTVHAESILVTRDMINLLLLSLRGPDAVHGAIDLLAVPGLDLVVRGLTRQPPVILLLNSVNPFTIWYVAALAHAMHILTPIAKRKALLIAGSLHLLRAAAPALLLTLLS